jgi:hypothetical protein
VLARIISRVVARRRLYTDDAFLLFALACICTGTGLITTFYHAIFIGEAVSLDPTVVITPDQTAALLESFVIIRAFFCITWTVTFSVKASFLALFERLIRRVSKRLTLYYWCAVVMTFLSWAFFMCELFIICPYTGTEIGKKALIVFPMSVPKFNICAREMSSADSVRSESLAHCSGNCSGYHNGCYE